MYPLHRYLSSTRIFEIYEYIENLITDTNAILSCENSQEGFPFAFNVWISLLLFNLTVLRHHSLGCSLLHFVASIHSVILALYLIQDLSMQCWAINLPLNNLSVLWWCLLYFLKFVLFEVESLCLNVCVSTHTVRPVNPTQLRKRLSIS